MIELYITIGLTALGFVAGTLIERAHYRRIRKRERAWLHVEVHTTRHLPSKDNFTRARLATGSAVISVDYFKRIAASLKGLFGGEIRAYSTLLDRARREALLRMKESQPDADMFINVRIETSTISGNTQNNSIGAVEALAFGTALWRERSA